MLKPISHGVCAPKGFTANGIHCGIRKNKTKKDLSLIYSEVPCVAAATYTQNKVKGAPIYVTQEHLQDGVAQAVLCNSGNANTCNSDGISIANTMSLLCAQALQIKKEDIIIASTGVIGQPLPIEPIEAAMPSLIDGLSPQKADDACAGIMTTDTFQKQCSYAFTIQGKECRIGGMAKGSGMIHPNMATMLSFVTSDVSIDKNMLDQAIHSVVDDTFNMVSVDGDTSTNDMLSVMCNGLANNPCITSENEEYEVFKNALYTVCETLSKMMASDGEGATKLLTCKVHNASTITDAKAIAKSIITSSLFKTAMFGCDANWGRILCAIGYAPANCNATKIDVTLSSTKGSLLVCENGQGATSSDAESGIDEDKALLILRQKEVEIIVDLKDGNAYACAWGCDLSYDYVKINGDYRT